MTLFLSKEKQGYTEPVLSIGLCWLPDEKDLNIITRNYCYNYIEYYLFNKIKICKIRKINIIY